MASREAELQILEQFVMGTTSHPTDQIRTAIALSWAREHGCYPEALQLAMTKRRAWLTWLTMRQREWQTKVSHRPERGRHHDSWQIREKYVRCH